MKKLERIFCVCGGGVGSSFMMELNLEKVIKKMGLPDIELGHFALMEVHKGSADLYVVGKDMYDACSEYGDCVVLENLVSMPELERKLTAYLNDKGYIRAV